MNSNTAVESNSPKLLIYGAGVLGSQFAAYFHESGLNVSLLARGEKAERYRSDGVKVKDYYNEDVRTYQVPIVESLEPEDHYDFILVLMQKHQAKQIVPLISKNRHYKVVVFLGNNITGFTDYLNTSVSQLDPEKVLIGFGTAGGMWENGYVHGVFTKEKTMALGPTKSGNMVPVNALKTLLNSAGIEFEVFPDSDAYLKAHGALILPLAFASYISNNNGSTLAKNKNLIRKSVKGIYEGLKVVKSAGYQIYPKKFRTMRLFPKFLVQRLIVKLFKDPISRIVMTGHAAVAKEEMRGLAREFELMQNQANIKTPIWDELRSKAGLL